MLGVLRENRLEDGAGLTLVRVGLVARGGIGAHRQRIKDRRLEVLGILRAELLHGFFVGQRAGVVVDLVGILIEDFHGADIIPLALRFGSGSFCRLHSSPSQFQIGWRGYFPERMVVGHGYSPGGHAAEGICFRYSGESRGRFSIPERMEHGHGAIELRLHGGLARSLKIHFAQLFWFAGGVFMLRRGGNRRRQ